MMIEIEPGVFVGSQADFEGEVGERDGWAVVHACKEPYHRQALGYTGRGAPKEHPEYLIAERDHRLMLNLVDVDDPKFVRPEIIDAAIAFIKRKRAAGLRVLIHCNQGRSRGPSIGLAYLAASGLFTGDSFETAEEYFERIYPDFAPAEGMRGFLSSNWDVLSQ